VAASGVDGDSHNIRWHPQSIHRTIVRLVRDGATGRVTLDADEMDQLRRPVAALACAARAPRFAAPIARMPRVRKGASCGPALHAGEIAKAGDGKREVSPPLSTPFRKSANVFRRKPLSSPAVSGLCRCLTAAESDNLR
jgi:hypothetical protein